MLNFYTSLTMYNIIVMKFNLVNKLEIMPCMTHTIMDMVVISRLLYIIYTCQVLHLVYLLILYPIQHSNSLFLLYISVLTIKKMIILQTGIIILAQILVALSIHQSHNYVLVV